MRYKDLLLRKKIKLFAIPSIVCIIFILSIIASTCAKNNNSKTTSTRSIASHTTKSKNDTSAIKTAENISSPQNQQKSEKKIVNVYLFHGTYRCKSCNLMEEMTIEAIQENFSKEKEQKTLVFEHINVEEPQNNHFINDYKLTSISIIISKKIDGEEKEWKNLNQVWMLLGDRAKFKEYIVKEIKSYL